MATEWLKVQKDYIQGVLPKELAEKYNTPVEAIYEKARKQNWKSKKDKLSQNIDQQLQDKIKVYSDEALKVLFDIIGEEDTRKSDKIAAARAILDVSGLKAIKTDSKIELSNKLVKIEVITEDKE